MNDERRIECPSARCGAAGLRAGERDGADADRSGDLRGDASIDASILGLRVLGPSAAAG